ncbi:restriction endonuclease subunit S [Enterobacter wuhouensis]|uniref:restriction endonuclease subunit S n=1 Tax=Enterobacter wuhouensis TaxID=2529381 RepID=UPI002FD29EE0
MAKYKAYPEYKDSGVEWLGEIPLNWRNLPHKYLAVYYKGRNPRSLSSEPKRDCVPYLSMSYLRTNIVEHYTLITSDVRVVPDDLVLIIWDGSNAGEFIKSKSGILSSTMAVANIIPKFNHQYYWFSCNCIEPEIRRHATGMGIPHVNGEHLRYIVMPRPSIEEQIKISLFLIYETMKIDLLVEKQQQLIELLKEKRQAVISHAVTKGLNPNVPMKDSGVEWLGDIPSHWNRTALKRLSSLTTGLTPPTHIEAYYAEEGHPWIRPEDLNEHGLYTYATKYVSDTGWSLLRHIKPNSTLVCCIGTIGKCGYIGETVSTNQQVTAVTFHNSGRFYFYLLKASRTQLEELATGNVLKILNSERLGALSVVKVNHKEAISIAKFLDHETIKIDTLIQKQLQQIELLKERRTALIAAAVTGKIDLRDWTPPASSAEASLTAEETTA